MLAGLKPPHSVAPRRKAKPKRPTMTAPERRAAIKATIASHGPMSAIDIAHEIDCSIRAVADHLNSMAQAGEARSWLETVDSRVRRLWALIGVAS